jgi:hypothetical protein
VIVDIELERLICQVYHRDTLVINYFGTSSISFINLSILFNKENAWWYDNEPARPQTNG